MKIAICLSLLMVGSFLVGFYVLSPFFPMGKISHNSDSQISETDSQVKNWGWTDDYCMRKLMFKDTSIILIPRCEF